MSNEQVLILGGGLMGLSIAHQLARRGRSVTVLSRRRSWSLVLFLILVFRHPERGESLRQRRQGRLRRGLWRGFVASLANHEDCLLDVLDGAGLRPQNVGQPHWEAKRAEAEGGGVRGQ